MKVLASARLPLRFGLKLPTAQRDVLVDKAWQPNHHLSNESPPHGYLHHHGEFVVKNLPNLPGEEVHIRFNDQRSQLNVQFVNGHEKSEVSINPETGELHLPKPHPVHKEQTLLGKLVALAEDLMSSPVPA